MKTKQTSEASHTPIPWIVSENVQKDIIDLKGELIARCLNTPEDVSFIVKCVNMHEELLSASRGLLNALQARLMRTGCNGPEESAIKALRQAIAKAEKGE